MDLSGDKLKLAATVGGLVAGATLFGCVAGGLTLAAAGGAVVGGLFGELAGGKAERLLDRLSRRRADILGNHDLAKLTANAITEVLREVETGDPAAKTLAAKAPVWWESFGQGWPEDLPAFRDADLVTLFIRPADGPLPNALTVGQWGTLVDDLARFAGVEPTEATRLTAARALHERLADVARNLAKEDASQDGRAAAGITLTLLGEAVDHLRTTLPDKIDAESRASLQAAERNAAQLAEHIGRIHADLQDRAIEVTSKLDKLAAQLGRVELIIVETRDVAIEARDVGLETQALLKNFLANSAGTPGGETDASKDRRIAELESALAEAQAAARAGDAEAESALADIRASGDAAKLQAFLERLRKTDLDRALDRSREIAAVAYTRGDIDEAERSLRILLAATPTDVDAVNRLGRIHYLRGRLDEAHDAFQRVAELATGDADRAVAYGNLGIVYLVRGDLREAELMHRKSLELNEQVGRPEGMASDYGNLGNVYRVRGDLDEAESMYRKSLAIEEKLGRPEGMADQYGNLGNVYQVRGDLDEAESMYRKSLELNEKLGRPEGMASDYGNLGNVYRVRGDLDEAESMYRKSLAIEEKLGRPEGMASDYANLGSVYKDRGDMAEACRCWRRALELFERVGARPRIEQVRRLIEAAGCPEA
ncbi:MAG: tetratricopeptide repeat protein [Planctomycetota bacterium]